MNIINLFSTYCIVCDSKSKEDICEYCLPSLPYIKKSCEHCGIILKNSKVCNFCNTQMKEFNKFIAVFYYQPPIRSIIRDFKYYDNYLNGKVLSNMLADKILSSYNNSNFPEIIIPVPNYYKKLKSKGFNQAIEISKYLKKKLNIDIDNNFITKIKDTKSQASLDKDARVNNLINSFDIGSFKDYKHIAIVDDVVTTGSTIMIIKKLIQKVLIDVKIDVWCLAKNEIIS